MTLYSHTRLSSFEQCKLRFKYKYIDKIDIDITSIEAFMGKLVHETLEKIYKDLKYEKVNTLTELLKYYNSLWEKGYTDAIIIVKKDYSAEQYRKMGERFISNYFEVYHPFNHAITIDTEKRIVVFLDNRGRYKLQGYIDRLAYREGIYEIHDYKTSSSLPTNEQLAKDRQLALYSLAVKKEYQHVRDIKLIWHYLAFGQEVVSQRSDEELEKLKLDTVQLIQKIESTTEFEPSVSKLCLWCEYQSICPMTKHKIETRRLSQNEYLKEKGVVLANKYAELSRKKKEIEEALEQIKEAIIQFCKERGVDTVFGSENKITLRTYQNVKLPFKNDPLRQELINVLKKLGKFDEVADFDYIKLANKIKNNEFDEETLAILRHFAKEGKTDRLYINKIYT